MCTRLPKSRRLGRVDGDVTDFHHATVAPLGVAVGVTGLQIVSECVHESVEEIELTQLPPIATLRMKKRGL